MMAFNWQTFKTRTLTAVIFAVVMLAGLLWNQWSFFILFSVIHFGCWIEYQKLVGLIDKNYAEITPFHRYGVMIAGWCVMLYFTNDAFTILGIRLHELGWWLGIISIFILPITELLFEDHIHLKNIGHSIFGLLYISFSLGLMINLGNFEVRFTDTQINTRNFPGLNPWYEFSQTNFIGFIPVVIIASIWINDTMAYIIGSIFGKTPLSAISPKKTWEGTIGGMVLSVVVVWLLCYYVFDFGKLSIHLALIASVASVFGTLGDLLESKLKRLAGVKDSGKIMPGHGGFLDRFDSMLIAIPFVWLYVYIFMR